MAIHDISGMKSSGHLNTERGREKDYISLRDIWQFLLGNLLILFVSATAGLVLGALYLASTAPTYTAQARLVMDPELVRIASQDASTGTIIIETAEIASQVEIVKSEGIARAVIADLNLTTDPELVDNRSWQSVVREKINGLINIISLGALEDEAIAAPTDDDIMRRTMAAFLSHVTVGRVGQSYVLEIGYDSKDPAKAATIANAIARAYIQTGMNERADAAGSGAQWLESRLIEIGRQAREAAMAAEEFRAKNGITPIGNVSSLDQQQLSEISSQMVEARAATAAESARLTTLDRLVAGEIPDGDIDESASNPQIQKLREDIRLATVRLNGLKDRYEPGNTAIIAATDEIARLQAEIRGEYKRIQGMTRSNLEIARAREKLLESQLADVTEAGNDKNLARVGLAEMESRAATYQRMYESVLQQLIGVLQKQSFPIGNARIVTAATKPLSKTWPKTSIVLPFSLTLGLAFGFAFALMRVGLNRSVGSGALLQQELGITALGQLPVYRRDLIRRLFRSNDGSSLHFPRLRPLRSILDDPYSDFSESLRSVKNSIDALFPSQSSVVIGITSVLPNDGKTTVAANLAQLYQNEGVPVVLVDADFENGTLSKVAAEAGREFGLRLLPLADNSKPTKSIVEQFPTTSGKNKAHGLAVLSGKASMKMSGQVPENGHEVPVVSVEAAGKGVTANRRYGHLPVLQAEIDDLRQRYAIVLVDMSSFEHSADARIVSTYVDGIMVVIGQSRTMTVERLGNALASFGKAKVRLLGVVFNRGRNRRRPGRSSVLSDLLTAKDDLASPELPNGHVASLHARRSE